MKITQVGVFPATAALVLTFTYGYSFIDNNPAKVSKASTSLSVNEESHIYGGTEADIDEYPFLASLRDPDINVVTCSGTLIAPQYILTAAHCTMKIKNLVAIFGTNYSSGYDLEEVQFRVVTQYRHPLYVKKTHLYDVGLLKLERPVRRKPAKLCARDGSDNMPGTMATALGWGKTEDANISTILEEVTLPIISNAECSKFEKYIGRVRDCMLCAGRGNGKDTCNGDSGGPLLVNDNILVGCVSWGSKCGEQAAIFTRLTFVMDYIDDILAGGDGSKFDVQSSDSPMQGDLSSPTLSGKVSTDATNTDSVQNSVVLSSVSNPRSSDNYVYSVPSTADTALDDDQIDQLIDKLLSRGSDENSGIADDKYSDEPGADGDKPTKMPGTVKSSEMLGVVGPTLSDSPMQKELTFPTLSGKVSTDAPNTDLAQNLGDQSLFSTDQIKKVLKALIAEGGEDGHMTMELLTGSSDESDKTGIADGKYSDKLDGTGYKPIKMPGTVMSSETPSDASSVLESAEQAYLAKEGKAKISLESSEATVDEPYSPNTENSVLQSVVQSDMNP
ncbi:unnamed protein product [Peronospora belbahrii]|uniref:Peptidase S1 domain-containing protein n=1 Tax=Peronospora belbahrii TaxID=622444 RepID=A0ABN8CRY7_9STRA|nr:unnamed protein product [Peronospora belbahrii]